MGGHNGFDASRNEQGTTRELGERMGKRQREESLLLLAMRLDTLVLFAPPE